jgi:hypothetical protein
MARFAEDVMAGRFHGKQSIWVAPEEVGGELTPFPVGFDHLRSIPVRLKEPQVAHAEPHAKAGEGSEGAPQHEAAS